MGWYSPIKVENLKRAPSTTVFHNVPDWKRKESRITPALSILEQVVLERCG
jgi:hypothetical protein